MGWRWPCAAHHLPADADFICPWSHPATTASWPREKHARWPSGGVPTARAADRHHGTVTLNSALATVVWGRERTRMEQTGGQ